MPDFLLVDMGMRAGAGLSLTRRVRTLARERGGRIPAATLTACPCVPERLAEWRRAGFQRHVPKPFAPDDLIAIVDELAGRVVERRTNVLLPAALPTDVHRERRREQREVRLC